VTRAAGLGFAVLIVAASAVLGDAPQLDDSAVTVADYFDDAHARVVTSFYLHGLAVACFVVFVSAFRGTALAAGVLFASCIAQSAIILGALAYRATDDAAVAQSLFDVAVLALNFAAFPAAVLVLATSPNRLRYLRSDRLRYLRFVVAGLLLVSGATFAGSGFFSPSGVLAEVAFGLFLLWVIAVGFAGAGEGASASRSVESR
jgi:hypothetical protein